MEPYWLNQNGTPGIRVALGDRSRLTRTVTEHWAGQCVVLEDAFDGPDYRRDLVMGAAASCPDARLIALTSNTQALSAYMERYQSQLDSLPHESGFPPSNVWFGTQISEEDRIKNAQEQIMNLLCTPSASRLLIAPADFKISEDYLVPKCKVCGGAGWVVVGNPFKQPHTDKKVCLECPARKLQEWPSNDDILRDKRRGGELNWVILTPAQDGTPVNPEIITLCLKYGTPLTVVANFDPATVPLWR